VLDCVGKGVLHATAEVGSSRIGAGSIAATYPLAQAAAAQRGR
jgi:hypothetical protein